MVEERRKGLKSDKAIVLLTLAGLICMPFAMIGSAVVEEKLFGTHYLADIAQAIGVNEPLQALHDAVPWMFGD